MMVRFWKLTGNAGQESLLIYQQCNDFWEACHLVEHILRYWNMGSYSEYQNIRIEIGER